MSYCIERVENGKNTPEVSGLADIDEALDALQDALEETEGEGIAYLIKEESSTEVEEYEEEDEEEEED